MIVPGENTKKRGDSGEKVDKEVHVEAVVEAYGGVRRFYIGRGEEKRGIQEARGRVESLREKKEEEESRVRKRGEVE